MHIYITKENEEFLRSHTGSMSGLINELLEDHRGMVKKAMYKPSKGMIAKITEVSVDKSTNVVKEGGALLFDRGKPEINEMFEEWEKITGMKINGQQKANRNACSNLLKKYGPEKLTQLIQGVAKAQSQEFAPQIASFTQLQAKQDSLILWGRKQAQEENNSEVVKI